MKNFIDHLSCFNLNESQYWKVPDLYQNCVYEIAWFRTKTGDPLWKIRAEGENKWQEHDNINIAEALDSYKIDLVEMRRCVADTVLKQTVYASQITESAKGLLGAQVVEQAVADNEIFLSELISKIKNVVSKQKNQHLKLVNTETTARSPVS